jgi:hypothetical protein
VCDAVYKPMWQARLKTHGDRLREYTLLNPPATRADLIRVGRGLIAGAAPDEACIGAAWPLIVAAVCVTLAPLGWTAETWPGHEVVLRRGDEELRPWSELTGVVEGRTTIASWRDRCARLGISDLPLAGAAAATF